MDRGDEAAVDRSSLARPGAKQVVVRIAVVHDYLTQHGGAERVALAMAGAFPGAPVITSLYDPEGTFAEFSQHDVRSTWLQRVVPRRASRHFRLAGPLFGPLFRHVDLGDYDAVLVSSSGFAHHVRHPRAFVYCHTPPRFIYDLDRYFANHLLARSVRPALPWLRARDRQAAASHAHYLANSAVCAERIRVQYGRSVGVLHPPLVTNHLPLDVQPMPSSPRALVVARLMSYKRIDLAIEACGRAGVPLTIVGTGPDEARLRSVAARMSGASGSGRPQGEGGVTFAGRLDDDELAEVFSAHSVVLMPGVEDFGMATIEANHAGRPVLARAAGGALETVVDGETGVLVASEAPDDWATALTDVLERSWDPTALRASTGPYSLVSFQEALRSWVATGRLTAPGRP